MAELAIGFAVSTGLSFVLSAVFPQTTTGARLRDLRAPKSRYGESIPRIYGTVRVPGNINWAASIIERKETKKTGIGKSEKNYSYYGKFSVLLADADYKAFEVGGLSLSKLWLQGQLVYNINSSDPETVSASTKFSDKYLQFLGGRDSQLPHSLIEADKGSVNVPGFIRKAYLTFNTLPLEKYGNSFPIVGAELIHTVNPSLGDVVKDICLTAGLTEDQIDVSALPSSTVVKGFILPQDGSTYRKSLEELMSAYLFYAVEDTAGRIAFRPIQQPVKLTIPEGKLAGHEYKQNRPDNYEEQDAQDLELPSTVTVKFYNSDLDYDADEQVATKQVNPNNNTQRIETQLCLTASEGKTIAYKLLYQFWARRRTYKFNLSPEWLELLEVGDVVEIPIDGVNTAVQIQKLNLGVNLMLEIEGALYDGESLSASMAADDIPRSDGKVSDPIYDGDVNLYVLDIPSINDSEIEPLLYVATEAPTDSWRNGTLLISENHGTIYNEIANLLGESVVGNTLNALGAASANLLDLGNYLDVEFLTDAEFSNISESDFFNHYNLALVNNEILAFQNATLIDTNTYRFSRFLRGVRGTENEITNHNLGDRFILLNGENPNLERILGTLSYINKELLFKALTGDQELGEVGAVNITPQGNSLKPYGVCQIRGVRNSVGDLTITWVRRSRKYGEWRDGVGVPLLPDETPEAYQVDILDGSNVVRTIFSFSPNVEYSAANQISDFGTIPASLTIKIYQISNLIGRGFSASGIV